MTSKAKSVKMPEHLRASRSPILAALLLWACAPLWSLPAPAAAQKDLPSPGIVREFSGSLEEVRQAVIAVQQDHIIHGTKVFDREPVLSGADAAESCPLFEPWQGPGEVFFKTRPNSIAPRHFLDTADMGTIAVRYVITPVTVDHIRVKIDAVYMESARRTIHASDGTVEKEEMKEIKDSLESTQQAAMEAADARRRALSAELVRQSYTHQREDEATQLESLRQNEKQLEEEIVSLRHEIERRVKAPGANLKAAPFQSAANLKSLVASTDVVVLIVTPHWLGVETADGQRGWLPIEQLELLP